MLVVEISPEELSSSLIPCSPDGAIILERPSEVDESPFELIEELLLIQITSPPPLAPVILDFQRLIELLCLTFIVLSFGVPFTVVSSNDAKELSTISNSPLIVEFLILTEELCSISTSPFIV